MNPKAAITVVVDQENRVHCKVHGTFFDLRALVSYAAEMVSKQEAAAQQQGPGIQVAPADFVSRLNGT